MAKTMTDWAGIRRACEAGLPMSEAAEKFGESHDNIRQRASRGKWLTPNRARTVVRKHFGPDQLADIMGEVSQKPKIVTPLPIEPEMAVAEHLATQGATLRATLLKLAQQGANRALGANLAVKDWSDANIVANIAAKAAGWDKADAANNQIAVQVLMSPADEMLPGDSVQARWTAGGATEDED